MNPQHTLGNESTMVLARIAALVASLIFVAFLVVGSSRAAFTDTTDNGANSVAAGTVTLIDDDAGSLLFNVSGMAPLDSATECIVVTYNGDLTPSAPIQLYTTGAVGGTGLEQYLNLTIEVGTGGSYGSCAGFTPSSTIFSASTLQTFTTTHVAYASALSTGWTPTGAGQTRTFRVTVDLVDDNNAQGLNTTFGFTWEARS